MLIELHYKHDNETEMWTKSMSYINQKYNFFFLFNVIKNRLLKIKTLGNISKSLSILNNSSDDIMTVL